MNFVGKVLVIGLIVFACAPDQTKAINRGFSSQVTVVTVRRRFSSIRVVNMEKTVHDENLEMMFCAAFVHHVMMEALMGR